MGVSLLLRADGRFGMTEAEKEFAALMRRIREGSKEAFCEVIDRYGTMLQKSIHNRMSPSMRRAYDSEDFVQSVWASCKHLSRWCFPTPQALMAYLQRMALNHILDEERRRRPGRHAYTDAQSLTPADSSFGNLEVPSRQPGPITTVAHREMLQKMCEGLDETERCVIDLVQAGFTREEIARQVGKSSRTVGRMVGRARRILSELSEESLP
jgi:RNA polymerase sigma factor (sigma-70 family)